LYITHPDFTSAVTPLQQFRQSQGISSTLIDVEDIYDEFNFGVPNPLAIKTFLSTATNKWSTPPHYLLLAGDASFDPRNYLGFGAFDFVPTGTVATSTGETASDDWLVDFNDDSHPDMAVGRIPSRTMQEASNMINKIIQYEQSPAGGSWNQQVMMVADNNDTTDFEFASSELASLIPGNLSITNVFLGQSDPSTARSQILNGIENGQLIVQYLGHGSVEVWAEEDLLTSPDAEAFTNGLRLPLVIALNCLNGYFHDVFTNSLAEAFLRNPNGGAVAVWASSGLTETSRQTLMDKAFLQWLFNPDEPVSLGEAIFRAKQIAIEGDVGRTWILFGDPLTRIYP
ncbi:MAG TPA: C25 family cysteine peptidase, partial [Acidobacteriota bacterium]